MDIPALTQNFDPRTGGLVEFGSDDKLYVVFHAVSVRNELKSQEAGRPVHDLVDFVKIQQPGERDFLDRPASQMDIRRFRRQWEAYKENRESTPEGSPLSVLFPNNPEIVDNLKFAKVFTVEQLAGLSDTQIQNIGMGGRTFHESAKNFLSAADKGKDYHVLAKKAEMQELKIQELTDKVTALIAALDKATADKPRRGRPPNPVSDEEAA